jgi:hypothetical protein
MADLDKALATQLANIQTRTGKSLDQLAALLRASGLTKHGELRDMLKRDLGLGHGDANTLVHHVLKSDGASAAVDKGADEVLDGIYKGPKAGLRPIHEALMGHIRTFGTFEEAPKKDYVSLRRKKQFAMIGPATNSRVEVGINVKGLAGTDRLIGLPPGGMCPFKVKVTTVAEVDDQLLAWLREAYTQAG